MTDAVKKDTVPKQRRFPKNPYRNILVCAKCGAAMRYEQSNLNGANPYVAYVCSAALKTGQCSKQRTRFAYVDNLIRQALEQEITLANDICAQIKAEGTPAALDRAEGQYQGKIQPLLSEIREINEEFQLLHTEYLVGNISAEAYQQQKQTLAEATRNAGQQIADATEKIKSFRALFTKANPWINLYQGKTLPEVLPQKLSKSFLAQVQLSPEGKISVTFREQEWKQKLIDMMEG